MVRGSTPGKRRKADTGNLFEVDCDVLYFERCAREAGSVRVAGIDEAGRGPLAGPVVAAAVILPEGLLIPEVNDSKQLTAQQRESLYDVIIGAAVAYGIGTADVPTIDEVNILQATIIAMEQALQAIIPPPDHLLIDALTLPRTQLTQKAIIKGDCRSHSIAAASILAKVTRDRMMQELYERYPQYNFQKHKGYGTKEHVDMIRKYGPCEAHRRSFEPVASMLREQG